VKHLQTKFHAHTMRESQVIRSKKVQIYHWVNIYCWVNLSCKSFFFFIDILLKIQQQRLICFCKYTCNSVIIKGFLQGWENPFFF